MPEGQYTGQRGKYVYTSDDGRTYVLTMDATLVLSNSGLTVFDPANPGSAQNKPMRFRPRGVYWEGDLNGRPVRKRLIAGTAASGLFSAASSQAITIDGVAGNTTGRVGERLTY